MRFVILTLVFLFSLSVHAQKTLDVKNTPAQLWNATKDGFLFNGYDVTTVFPEEDYPNYPVDRRAVKKKAGETGGYTPTPVEGDREIFVELILDGKSFKLAFASEKNRQRFLDAPEDLRHHYVPKFGGWCAKAMASGFLVPIVPTASNVIPDADGNLVFFTQANTIARAAFLQNIDMDYGMAELNWADLSFKSSKGQLDLKGLIVESGGGVALGKAVLNAFGSFLSSTPEASQLQLLPPPTDLIQKLMDRADSE